jgi:hypothetical protein
MIWFCKKAPQSRMFQVLMQEEKPANAEKKGRRLRNTHNEYESK